MENRENERSRYSFFRGCVEGTLISRLSGRSHGVEHTGRKKESEKRREKNFGMSRSENRAIRRFFMICLSICQRRRDCQLRNREPADER